MELPSFEVHHHHGDPLMEPGEPHPLGATIVISDETWDRIAEEALGSPTSPSAFIDKYELEASIEDVEEALLDRNIETCPICGWWVESGEMTDELTDEMICYSCYWDTHTVLEVSE